jgi:hypothetical protein
MMLQAQAQQQVCLGKPPPVFDGVQELKRDVYVRQGVRYRGTGPLRSDEYTMFNEGGRHCGQPWEWASWAVAVWFAQKWKYHQDGSIVGGVVL